MVIWEKRWIYTYLYACINLCYMTNLHLCNYETKCILYHIIITICLSQLDKLLPDEVTEKGWKSTKDKILCIYLNALIPDTLHPSPSFALWFVITIR